MISSQKMTIKIYRIMQTKKRYEHIMIPNDPRWPLTPNSWNPYNCPHPMITVSKYRPYHKYPLRIATQIDRQCDYEDFQFHVKTPDVVFNQIFNYSNNKSDIFNNSIKLSKLFVIL